MTCIGSGSGVRSATCRVAKVPAIGRGAATGYGCIGKADGASLANIGVVGIECRVQVVDCNKVGLNNGVAAVTDRVNDDQTYCISTALIVRMARACDC